MYDDFHHKLINHTNSNIIFGCEQLGGYEWGDVDINSIEHAISCAIDCGVRVFDTADCYGNGLSEERLGKVLDKHRDKVFIATKYGVKISSNGVYYDSSPEWAKTALDASLKRLKTDYIDLFQMHYWDGVTPFDDVCCQLENFIKEGKIRAYGFTNVTKFPQGFIKRDGLQTMSLEYSLANRQHELVSKSFVSNNFSFLSYGSLGQGVLTGKYNNSSAFSSADRRSRKEYKNFHGEHLENNLRIVCVLNKWSQQLDVSIPVLALKWISRAVPKSLSIVGFKSVSQLEGVIGVSGFELPDEAFRDLNRVSSSTDVG